jgi:uncharacterized protein (DUF779 family)
VPVPPFLITTDLGGLQQALDFCSHLKATQEEGMSLYRTSSNCSDGTAPLSVEKLSFFTCTISLDQAQLDEISNFPNSFLALFSQHIDNQ